MGEGIMKDRAGTVNKGWPSGSIVDKGLEGNKSRGRGQLWGYFRNKEEN